MTSILAVAGSPSNNSRTVALIGYMTRTLAERGAQASALNVRDLDSDELLGGKFDGATIVPALQQVAAANGLIIATPVYKASYTGVLKTFLDVLPAGALTGKVVLPVALGGSLAHSLIIDYALRPVLAALGAVHVLQGLYLIDKQIEHEAGQFVRFAAPEAEAQVNAALEQFYAIINTP